MSAYSCKHSTEWPLSTLYKWFAQPGERATADISGATIGNESIVTVQATSNQYIRQIAVEEVNDLLDKVNNCSGCINDLCGQATEFLNAHSEARSSVGAFLYAATAYDRAQKCSEEGVELERIQEVLERALADYQKSHNEKCLHSVIKYRNVDVVKYLFKEHLKWSECHIDGCIPLKLPDGNEKILAALGHISSNSFYAEESRLIPCPTCHPNFAGRTEEQELQGVVSLPLPQKDFTGREVELQNLHTSCQEHHQVAISGMGGAGKTSLALKYASVYQDSYQWIHFVRGDTPQILIEDLLKLADKLHIPKIDPTSERLGEPRTLNQDDRLALLKDKLNHFNNEYLLIVDGVDDPQALETLKMALPQRGKCLLVASRLKNQLRSQFQLFPLGNLKPSEAAEYLLKAVDGKDTHRAQAEGLAKKLGYLPLALKHAAAYIRQTPGYTFERYLSEFDLSKFKKENLYLDQNEETILTTWNKSIETIIKDHHSPLAKVLLEFLSVLGTAPFPSDLIETWFKTFQSRTTTNQDLSNALRHLQNYSLLEDSKFSHSIHSLVQKVSKYQLNSEERKKIEQQALDVCRAFCSGKNAKEVLVRRQSTLWVPHLLKVSETNQSASNQSLEKLSEFLWQYHYYEGQYKPSQQHAERLFQLSQDDKTKAFALTYLSISKSALGENEKALDYQIKAFDIFKRLEGEKHPNTMASLNNIGSILKELGRYKEALHYHASALAIFQDLHGGESDDIAKSLSSFGTILGHLGRHIEALYYKEQALAMKKRLLGEEHPSVAESLSSTGSTLQYLGRYEEALLYQEQALTIAKKLVGEEHPFVAHSLNNYGTALGYLGRHKEALKCLEQALAMRKRFLGEEHPFVANSLNNIGATLGHLDRHEEALYYKEQALAMRKRLLGEEHPSVANSLNNVGYTLGYLGRYEEALLYQEQALELTKALRGEKHPFFLTSFNNLKERLTILSTDQMLTIEKREKIIADIKSMTISQPQKDELVSIMQTRGYFGNWCSVT